MGHLACMQTFQTAWPRDSVRLPVSINKNKKATKSVYFTVNRWEQTSTPIMPSFLWDAPGEIMVSLLDTTCPWLGNTEYNNHDSKLVVSKRELVIGFNIFVFTAFLFQTLRYCCIGSFNGLHETCDQTCFFRRVRLTSTPRKKRASNCWLSLSRHEKINSKPFSERRR